MVLSRQDYRRWLGGETSQMLESGSIKGSVSRLFQIATSTAKSFRLIHSLFRDLLFLVCSKLGQGIKVHCPLRAAF